MRPTTKIKQIVLAIGDVLILYLALALTLIIRYRQLPSGETIDIHLQPFSLLFLFWILVFYIVGLYEIRRLKNNLEFFKNFGSALAINSIISVIFFYLLTNYGIAPKTNLLIFIVVVFFLEYIWRAFYNNFIGQRLPQTRALLVGKNETTSQLLIFIKQNPQLGYDAELCQEVAELIPAVSGKRVEIIVIEPELKRDPKLTALVYKYLTAGLEVVDTTSFYETLQGKLPVSDLGESWFLETIIHRRRLYDFFRIPLEILLAIVLIILLSPLLLLTALLIKLVSPGSIFFSHTRIGELGRPFTLYKFRSMVANAEKHGAEWVKDDDSRITFLGRLLRRTHLDELPQLFNIIRGELSFVGPRPERPEFVEQLKETIPYYELRQIVKPGITGWAQINYRRTVSIEEAFEKLQYDLYYVKNRSLWLDLGIIIKTIKMFFVKN